SSLAPHLAPRACPECICSSNALASTEIYTLSLHDALPISLERQRELEAARQDRVRRRAAGRTPHQQFAARESLDEHRCGGQRPRSEEHTSELQSRENLVCRLLLEKKKTHRDGLPVEA